MPPVQGTDSPEFLVCAACKEVTDDWACVTLSPVQTGATLTLVVCMSCLSILEHQLGADFEKDKELLCSVDEFGKLIPMPKDNN